MLMVYLLLIEGFYLVMAYEIAPDSNVQLFAMPVAALVGVVVIYWIIKFFRSLYVGFRSVKGVPDDVKFQTNFDATFKPNQYFDLIVLAITVVTVVISIFLTQNPSLRLGEIALASIGLYPLVKSLRSLSAR